jgi:prevent-host-death family protein
MKTVNMHEAKTHLSRLIASHEPFLIAKAGKPMVKVTPIDDQDTLKAKRIGFLKGKFEVPDDFDQMGQDEITRLFGYSE